MESDEDTAELKNILLIKDDNLLIKDRHDETVEVALQKDDTLRLNGNSNSLISAPTTAAPDSEGRDNLAPDQ